VDYVLDSGPLIYLLFWNQQQMHHPQSMQQTSTSGVGNSFILSIPDS